VSLAGARTSRSAHDHDAGLEARGPARGGGIKMSSSTAPTAISSHLAVRPDWLAKSREAALEPELPIVDPHHHLIDRPESGTYLLPDLLADIVKGGHNIVATVYLEWL